MEASRAVRPPRRRASLQLAPRRVKRQADPAFEQLYKRHAREVYQYALALTANPADAEDVTQTTFLNAYRAYERGERPLKPHNWLITIAHNVCRMRWRQAGSRPREVALEEAPEPAAHDPERPDLDEVLIALARLSFNQRAALVMRELEGRSYQEIASVLDLSVSAVEALLFRARRRLRLERTALAAITSVPLPGSLSSFLGAGGGAVAAGGAAIGADIVLKAAAVVAAGAVTAGLGYQSVGAISHPQPPADAHAQVQARAAAPKAKQRLAPTSKKQRRAVAAGRGAKPTKPLPAATQSAHPAPGTISAPTAQASAQPAAAPPPPPAPVVSAPVASIPAATLPLPEIPPPPPPPPVTVPELPPVPPLPITVTTPIPPPPPLK